MNPDCWLLTHCHDTCFMLSACLLIVSVKFEALANGATVHHLILTGCKTVQLDNYWYVVHWYIWSLVLIIQFFLIYLLLVLVTTVAAGVLDSVVVSTLNCLSRGWGFSAHMCPIANSGEDRASALICWG